MNVSTAGTYTLEFRVASSGGGGTFHVDSGTQNISGPISIHNTGGWQTWTTVTKTGVNLSAGPQVWTVRFDAVGTGGAIGNLNWIRVTSGGTPPPPPPPPALPTLPGTLQAEDFDTGAQNVAYVDNSPGNDRRAVSHHGCGHRGNVGYRRWIQRRLGVAGEWLRYTVNVTTAGTYDIELRVASGGAGGTFQFQSSGVNKTGTLTIPEYRRLADVDDRARNGRHARGGSAGVAARNGDQRCDHGGGQLQLDPGRGRWWAAATATSATTTAAAAPEIVIYGSDVTTPNLHGNWSRVTDATAAGNTRVASADRAEPTVSTPFAAPADYFEATFNAVTGVRYRFWLRMSATANNKFNDSVWVQFSGSTDSGGNQRYRIGTGRRSMSTWRLAAIAHFRVGAGRIAATGNRTAARSGSPRADHRQFGFRFVRTGLPSIRLCSVRNDSSTRRLVRRRATTPSCKSDER